MQTPEQLQALRALCQENSLGKEDVWQHGQHSIVSRVGIEKLQAKYSIQVELQLAAGGVDFAIVKATASRSIKSGGTVKKVSTESFGSAQALNSEGNCFAELAEKRAKGRAILMLLGFSKYGAYDEDAAEALAPPRPTQPAAPAPSAPASLPQAPSAGAAPSTDADADDFLALATIIDLIKSADTLEELQGIWSGEAKPYQKETDVFAAKEERKAYLLSNQTLAA